MQKTLKSLARVLLVGAVVSIAPTFAGDESAQSAEPQEIQQVQTSDLDEVSEARPVALLLGESDQERECVVMLALYFSGDPSMQGVTLFSILQECG